MEEKDTSLNDWKNKHFKDDDSNKIKQNDREEL